MVLMVHCKQQPMRPVQRVFGDEMDTWGASCRTQLRGGHQKANGHSVTPIFIKAMATLSRQG